MNGLVAFIFIDFRAGQAENAVFSINCKVLGKVILASLVHSWNADVQMVVTPSGMMISVRL